MNKKVYATPAMNVVELEVSDIVCSTVSGVSNSEGISLGGDSSNDTGGPRGRGRGNSIWDE